MGVEKTVAMKLLTGKKIAYTVRSYDAAIRDAEAVATAVGADPQTVYKTLVLPPPGTSGALKRPLLILIPAPAQLDLKKTAKALGVKKVKMATHSQAEQLTGLQVGGISPLALLNKGFTIYLDQSARALTEIVVSAGKRGLQIQLAVKDLLRVTRARWIDAASG